MRFVLAAGTNEGMKKQMIAERERRGDFIRAEGNKAARKLASEGTKIVKYNMGLAEQDAARKRCVRVAAWWQSEGQIDFRCFVFRCFVCPLLLSFSFPNAVWLLLGLRVRKIQRLRLLRLRRMRWM